MDEIKNIVNNVIKNISEKKTQEYFKVEKEWKKAIDGKYEKHVKVYGIKEDILYINVDSSAMLYQLNWKKKDILKKIQKEIPEIKKIYFRIGQIK